MKPHGLLFFHQGWTDIFNSLGLLNWHLKAYEKLTVLIRMDAMPLMDFYCRQFGDRVELEFHPKELLDIMTDFSSKYGDLLLHGIEDRFRTDEYTGMYTKNNHHTCVNTFVNTFYTLYGIPAETRINDFQIERELSAEEVVYEQFTKQYGINYRLTHSIKPLPSDDTMLQTVDLNQSSDIFFDMIKVLENAKEIHLLDSSWAALIYLLDTKYGLFQHIPVKLYCARKYITMFSDPVKLPNWTFYVLDKTTQ